MAEGDQTSTGKVDHVAGDAVPSSPTRTGPPPLRLDGLLLLDSAGNHPVNIEAVTFADDGIGVIRSPGDPPRVLPWSSVSAHMVERWGGGSIPEWWVDPELERRGPTRRPDGTAVDPQATNRALPHAEPGAVIAIQTPFGTYRFLLPGGDSIELSNKITDFAVRHQGLSGVPSNTLVARPQRGSDRRQGSRSAPVASPWSRVQPYLVAALVVVIALAVTLILLQSAGAIHLPYLGGASPGTVIPVRTQ